jgi:hypothetical protein
MRSGGLETLGFPQALKTWQNKVNVGENSLEVNTEER